MQEFGTVSTFCGLFAAQALISDTGWLLLHVIFSLFGSVLWHWRRQFSEMTADIAIDVPSIFPIILSFIGYLDDVHRDYGSSRKLRNGDSDICRLRECVFAVSTNRAIIE
jgi:hypothetical protein